MNNNQDYGLRSLVLINSLVFVIFAFSLATRRVRVTGAFSARSHEHG